MQLRPVIEDVHPQELGKFVRAVGAHLLGEHDVGTLEVWVTEQDLGSSLDVMSEFDVPTDDPH